MASYNGHYIVQVTDINGDVATVKAPFHASDAGTLASLVTALGAFATVVAAATNGKITRQSISVLINEAQFLVGVTPPTNAEYSSVTDGARLQFANGNGERLSVTVPAVIEAAFGASSNVVDSLQAQVAALIAWVEANAGSPAGSLYNLYKGGIKIGKRARRRRSALIP